MQTSNNWPYVQLIQTESELDRDEIKVSDSYGWDEFSNKSQSQIDKKVAQIDKRAEKEINKFQNIFLLISYIMNRYIYPKLIHLSFTK